MDSTFASEPSTEGMPTTSFVAALVATTLGAFVWGAVAYFTGYEVGYVAWGLGGLVGWAMARFGGRGTTCAIIAAVLSVAGIASGKLLGTRFVVDKQLHEQCQATFTPALHAEFVRDAADLAQLGADPGEDELREFMVEHHYTGAASPREVKDAELRTFRTVNVPDLAELHAKRPAFADWYAQREAQSHQAFEAEFSIVQANLQGLNPIDLLFVFLGVSTAFGIVRRAGARSPAPAVTSGQAPAPAAPSTTSAGEQDFRKAA